MSFSFGSLATAARPFVRTICLVIRTLFVQYGLYDVYRLVIDW